MDEEPERQSGDPHPAVHVIPDSVIATAVIRQECGQ